jgi:hypothetical protein
MAGMLRFLLKAAFFGLAVAYLVKMLSARRNTASSGPPEPGARRRIRTDGMPVRDAEFSEMSEKEGGRI